MKLAIRPYLIPLRSGNELPGSVIYFGKVFNKRISENMMGVAWYRKLIDQWKLGEKAAMGKFARLSCVTTAGPSIVYPINGHGGELSNGPALEISARLPALCRRTKDAFRARAQVSLPTPLRASKLNSENRSFLRSILDYS